MTEQITTFKKEQEEQITLEHGKELRWQIFNEAKKALPNPARFFSELEPGSSLTIFNAAGETTRSSVINVVKRYLDRCEIDKRDEEKIEEFKNYLDSLI